MTDLERRASFSRLVWHRSVAKKHALQPDKENLNLIRAFICARFCREVLSAFIVSLLLFPVVSAQQSQANTEAAKESGNKSQASSANAKPSFTLTVKAKPILNISLKAEKANLSEVAESLSKQLKTTVMVAPVLAKQLITIEYSELTLEPAMQLMAPEVYIDYQFNTSSTGPVKTLGIFFYPVDGEPSDTAVAGGSTQSLLIEGDTEDGVEPTTDEQRKRLEEQPLRVQFKDNSLSIKAKKQPLSLVLLKIGEELGIPVDIESESTDIVDTEINKLPVEEALRHLSPKITVFMRADLQRAERRALRLVLGEPSKNKPQSF
ncbi:MAG: hypothetical protein C5B55_03380 [Blastocatellia bacterium]|nr:MAG: hypothetical protein C5B55_03380 [Blastocatellia bacterium]